MKRRMPFVLLALLVVVLLPAAWFVAGKLHRFAYWIGRKTDAEVAALATGGWRVDRFEVEPGVELVGLVRPPRDAAARWILFLPGNSSGLLDGFRGVLDGLRGGDDVGMAFWAYRGFEASGGVPTPAALADDAVRQWDRCVQVLGAKPERLELWAYSLGTPLAVHAAARLAGRGQPPPRLVLAAAGERIPVMRYGALGRFLPDDVFEAGSTLAGVRSPTVIVHGAADDALPIDGARRLAQALGTHCTLHEVPGRGHVDLWDDVRRLAW